MRTPTGRTVRLGVLAAAVIAASCTGITVLASQALMTDARTSGAATVSSGSLALSASGGAAAGSWLGGMSVGPGAPGYQALTITNSGTVPLRYAATSTATDTTLAPNVQLDVTVVATGTTCAAAVWASSPSIASRSGATLGASDGSSAVPLIGDITTGADTGDRRLAAGATEKLCLRASLATGLGLGRSLVGTSATSTIAVVSENA